MSAGSQAHPTIVQPGEGKDLDFGPDGVATVMLSGEHSGGMLTAILTPVAPGGGPPLHVHEHDDELFLVVEGHISYFVDGRWTDVGRGGIAYFPKGTPHCYRNDGTTLSRHWILTTPAGFETFFARFAEEVTRSDGPSEERLLTIHREHGYTILGDASPRTDGDV